MVHFAKCLYVWYKADQTLKIEDYNFYGFTPKYTTNTIYYRTTIIDQTKYNE